MAAAANLVGSLHKYEQELGRLFAEGGRLSVAIAEAQSAEARRVGYLGGHEVVAAIAEAHAHVGQAISRVADGHRKLTKLGKTIGYDFGGMQAFGDAQKDPSAIMTILTSLVAQGTNEVAPH